MHDMPQLKQRPPESWEIVDLVSFFFFKKIYPSILIRQFIFKLGKFSLLIIHKYGLSIENI